MAVDSQAAIPAEQVMRRAATPVHLRRQAFRATVLLALGLAFAVVAQAYLMRRQFPLDGAIFYVVAMILFYLAVRRVPEWTLVAAEAVRPYPLWRVLPAVALAFIAFVLFRQGQSNNGLMVTIVAFAVLVAAYWKESVTPSGTIRLERWEWAALGGIVLLGLALRVYRLASFPGDLYLDEGDFGVLALDTINARTYSPFTKLYTGQHTFFFYGLGLVLKILGISATVARLPTTVLGVLTIVAVYFLGRELLGPRGAVIAAFVMAVSHWHIAYSRIVFPGSTVPFFAAVTMCFLLRGVRTRQPLDFIWSGFFLTLTLNTYQATRVLPIVMVLYFVHKSLAVRSFARAYAPAAVLVCVATLVTFVPLGEYFLRHPDDVWSRAQAASVTLDIQREKSLAPFWANVRKAFGMFNYQGDPRPRHNAAHQPMVDAVTGMFLALGFGYALLRWRKPEHGLLLSWMVLGVVPGVFSLADSNPHSLRTITILPAVCLLAALGAERAASLVLQVGGVRSKQYLLVVAAVLAAASLAANYNVAFGLRPANRDVYYDFDPVQNAVAREVVRLSGSSQVFVAASFTNHSAVKFLARGMAYQTFNQSQHVPVRDSGGKSVTFILDLAQRQILTLIQKYYPGATIKEWRDRYGSPGYYIVTISPEQIASAYGARASYYAGGDRSQAPALERLEETIMATWAKDAPLPAPFAAVWRTALYVPRYGPHRITVESSHPVSVTLGSEVILETAGGVMSTDRTLVGGFHMLEVATVVGQPSGNLSLRWRTPDGAESVIPKTALFSIDVARNGLLGKYYAGNAWMGAPVVQQIDLFIFPNDLLAAPFSIEWEGKIYCPQEGQYVFGTSSDDGSLLYINNTLVVDNGGHHSERYVEGRINLTQGLHDIRLRYFQDDGGRTMELYWTPPGGRKEMVPSEALFPPNTVLTGPVVLPTPAPPVVPPTQPVTPVPGRPGVAPPAPGGPRAGELGFLSAITGVGTRAGELRGPRGVGVDAKGVVYVADTGNKRVLTFDRSGNLIGELKPGSEAFHDPVAVVIAPNGEMFVLEPEKDGARRFGPNGDYRGRIGEGLGLYRPRGLAIDASGVLYFANTGGNNIVRASATGQLLGVIGSSGKGNGQFDQPTDVAVAPNGDIFVADTYNQRIQRLTPDGRYAAQWPIPAAGTAFGPHLTIGPDGTVYATAPDAHQISAYSPDGALLATWGGQGTGNGQFIQPVGLFMDASGILFIADSGNNRIQIWGKP